MKKTTLAIIIILWAVLSVAEASTTGGNAFGGKGLKYILDSLTGSNARIIGGIAMAAGILVFMFGGEMTDLVKRLVYIAFALGFLVNVSGIVIGMQGAGALV